MSQSKSWFSWPSFFLGAVTGGVATVMLGVVMMMVLAVGAIAAVGDEANTQFEQIAAEMEADASAATFEEISGELTP